MMEFVLTQRRKGAETKRGKSNHGWTQMNTDGDGETRIARIFTKGEDGLNNKVTKKPRTDENPELNRSKRRERRREKWSFDRINRINGIGPQMAQREEGRNGRGFRAKNAKAAKEQGRKGWRVSADFADYAEGCRGMATKVRDGGKIQILIHGFLPSWFPYNSRFSVWGVTGMVRAWRREVFVVN
jgi:hypothetical protein